MLSHVCERFVFIANRLHRIWYLDQFKPVKVASKPEDLPALLKPEEYQQFGEPLRANHLYDIAFSQSTFVQSKLKVSCLTKYF